MRNRHGYALLAVLWICTGITAIATLVLSTARDGVASARNRTNLAAASWNSLACLAHARAVLTEALVDEAQSLTPSPAGAWQRVEGILGANQPASAYACQLTAAAVGSRLDANTADAVTLATLYHELGLRPPQADSAAVRTVSNRPFFAVRQLRSVLGPALLPGLESVLDVEPGPISLNHASPLVLGLLPGVTPELVDRVMDAREQGLPISSFSNLANGLSPDARETLALEAARLPALVALEPIAWVLTATSSVGKPPVTAVVEARLGRSGAQVTLVRQRAWIQ